MNEQTQELKTHARKPWGQIVLGILVLAAAAYFLGQAIAIVCNKSGADLTCTLTNQLFGMIKLSERSVPRMTGARLDIWEKPGKVSSNDVTYRVVLITQDGEVLPTAWYSSGDVAKQKVVDEINQFIRDPSQLNLKTSLPLLSFWEKETPLYILIVAGILGYSLWYAWRKNKKNSAEVANNDYRKRALPEKETPAIETTNSTDNWNRMSAPQIGGSAEEAFRSQEGASTVSNLFQKLEDVKDRKIREKIEEDFSPEWHLKVLALYEPLYLSGHGSWFLDILRRAKGNIFEVEKLIKIAERVGYDPRSWFDEVGV